MTGSGQMVVQPAFDFLIGGLNPGRVHMPPMAVDWKGFGPQELQLAALPFDHGLL